MPNSRFRLYETTVFRYNLPVGDALRQQMSAAGESSEPTLEGRTDMDVRGIGPAFGAIPAKSASGIPTPREATQSKPVSPEDVVEISAAGKMLDQLSQTPDIRQARIAQIKAEIENGTYDTDAKLEAALSKMFDSLGLETE